MRAFPLKAADVSKLTPSRVPGGTFLLRGLVVGAAMAFVTAAGAQTLSIDERPDPWVTHRSEGVGTIPLTGTYTGSPLGIEARAVEADSGDPVTPWQLIDDAPATGTFAGELTDVPEGGWYRVEARPTAAPADVAVTAGRVGVGVIVAAIGQSNMVKHFTEDEADGSVLPPFETPHPLTTRLGYGEPGIYTYARPRSAVIPVSWGEVTGTGGIRLANGLAEALGVPVLILDVSVDWTGLLKDWNDTSGNFRGWTDFAAVLAEVGSIDAVLWHQGAFDAQKDDTTVAGYLAGLDQLYAQITDIVGGFGTLPFLVAIQNRGVYDDLIWKDDTYNAVRRAQLEWIDTRAHGFAAGSSIDMDISTRPGTGDGHFWARNYAEMSDRYTRGVLHALGVAGYEDGVDGGRLVEADVQGTTVTVRVAHDLGTRLRLRRTSPEAQELEVEGFTVTDGPWVVDDGQGGETRRHLPIVSARLSDDQADNWVVIELAQVPAGPVKVRYLYGQNPFRDKATDAERRASGHVLYDDFAYHPDRDGLPIHGTTVDLEATPVIGIEVDTTSLTVTEGGSASLDVWLTQAPTGAVTVTATAVGDADFTAGASPSFDAADWSIPQTVTVTAATDADTVDGTGTLRLSGPGLQAVAVPLTENDTDPHLEIEPRQLGVSERGGTASFQVALGEAPASTVTLDLAADDPARLQLSPTRLTFGPGDWQTPRAVTVTGLDDGTLESGPPVTITLAVDDAASDDAYDSLADETVIVDLLGLDAGLLLHLPLDETAGTVATDVSGAGAHGTLGADVVLGRDGIVGTAVGTAGPGGTTGSFDDAVLVEAVGSGGFEQTTIAFWYRLDPTAHSGYLFHWGGSYNQADTVSLYFDASDDELRLRVHDASDATSSDSISPAGFQDGEWHHLAVAKGSDGTDVYFDGAFFLHTAHGDGPITPTDGFGLGTNESGTFGAEASFDEVRVYDRRLLGAEVASLHAFEARGRLSVDLEPADAVAAGARWRLVSGPDTSWQSDGATLALDPGPYTVRFEPVVGWVPPADLEVEIEPGEEAEESAVYLPEGQGLLRVEIGPEDAVTAGARWRLSSGPAPSSLDTSWRTSGSTATGPAGVYTVQFEPVVGWIEPDDASVTTTAGSTEVVTGTYLDASRLAPLAHLPLDETAGTVAVDLSGHGHHGTYGGDVRLDRDGVFGRAVTSTAPGGSSGSAADGLTLPTLGGQTSYDQLTVSFWYRLDVVHDGYLFYWGGTYNRADALSLYLDAGQGLRLRVHPFDDTTSFEQTAPSGFDDTSWHHVVLVKDSFGSRLYLDGAEVLETAMGDGPITPSDPFGLGTNEYGQWGVAADFDDLRIWARPLAPSEVADLWNAASTGSITGVVTPSTAVEAGARWRLLEGADTSFQPSGAGLQVEPGQYTVEFSEIEGRLRPPRRVVQVGVADHLTVIGDYPLLPTDPPILHLPLDETAGSTLADVSGQGRDATAGSRVRLGLEGVWGTAVQLAGPGIGNGTVDDGIRIEDLAPDDTYDYASVALWYRLPAEPHAGYLFYWGGTHNDPSQVSAYLDPGTGIRVRVHDAADTSSFSTLDTPGFDDGAWHHLAVVKDPFGSRVYLDGSLAIQSSDGDGPFTPSEGLRLGTNEIGVYGLEATVDDFRVYDRLLTAQEVADLYGTAVPPTGLADYRSVDEIRAHLDQAALDFPSLVELVDYGDSFAKGVGGVVTPDGDLIPGDDLVAARLTHRGVGGSKPVFFLMACLHAREIATPELALRFLDELLAGYGIDPEATWLLDHHEIWILPVTNPDGHRHVELGAEPIHGSVPWKWRKNGNPGPGSCDWPPESEGDTYGVDLNRNFPFQWGTSFGQAGGEYNCSPYFRGLSATSEPETSALISLLSSLIPDQRGPLDTDAAPDTATGLFLQLHSPLRTIGWPWAHTDTPAPNGADLARIGQKLADYSGYPADQAHDAVYAMTGTADDWVYGELGAAALLIEVGEGLMPAYHHIDNTLWPEVRDALRYVAKIARTPYLTVRGPDVSDLVVGAGEGGVDVTATADDGGNGGEAIAAVEAYLAVPPWQTGATAVALTADDGSFDSVAEGASGFVSTAGLSAGRYLLWIRARDASGHWGPVAAGWVDVP